LLSTNNHTVNDPWGVYYQRCLAYLPVVFTFVLCTASAHLLMRFYAINWPVTDDFITVDWYRLYFIEHSISLLKLFFTASDGPHPLGIQALVTIYLFYIFGINFNVLVAFNLMLSIVGASLISLAVYDKLKQINKILLWLSTVLISFLFLHPAQIYDTLVPFITGWIIIKFILCFNILLIELRPKKYWAVTPIAAVAASFCSAHGVFIWPAAMLHVILKRDAAYRLSFITVGTLAFVAELVGLSRMDIGTNHLISLTTLPQLFLYQLGLIGGEFGIRDVSIACVLGGILFISLILLLILAYRRKQLSSLDRVGIVLSLGSYMMVVAFSMGRFKYGLSWALADFHSSMLVAPFTVGCFLLSLSALTTNKRSFGIVKVGAVFILFFIISSIAVALPYAREAANRSAIHRELALFASCSPSLSSYLLGQVNGIGDNDIQLIKRNMPMLEPLCNQPMSKRVRQIATFPPFYQALVDKDPATSIPLHKMWDVYLTHGDLLRSFHVGNDESAQSLLQFFRNNALTGSKYEHDYLAADAWYFSSLPAR
jgi:hypothetical protein